MNDHYAKNSKLREENMELASKLKNLIEQYELREQVCERECRFHQGDGFSQEFCDI